MLRRSHIITATALLAVAAAPASAAPYEQLHDTAPPPSSIATPAGDEYQGVRSPDLPPVHYPTPKVATEPPAPIVTVTESPSGGFDWGDAGIGAAGIVALFGVAGGLAVLLLARRRRRDVRVATH
jgi:hypothetical protein